ncbi:MAG TPA: hypothetical protein DD437_11520 [Rhodobiaceae bacterium]|nr:hypothetical protein [Rhodobiaceae bacterium]
MAPAPAATTHGTQLPPEPLRLPLELWDRQYVRSTAGLSLARKVGWKLPDTITHNEARHLAGRLLTNGFASLFRPLIDL